MRESTKHVKKQADGIFRAYCTGRYNNKALRGTTEAENQRFNHYFNKLMELHKIAETQAAHSKIDRIVAAVLERHSGNLEYLRSVGR